MSSPKYFETLLVALRREADSYSAYFSNATNKEIFLAEAKHSNVVQLKNKLAILKQDLVLFNSSVEDERDQVNIDADVEKIGDILDACTAKFLYIQAQQVHTASQPSQPSSQISHTMSLPTIQIPVFDGNQNDFNDFYSLFKELVDNDSKLSELQKFYYLKSVLKGNALLIISEFKLEEVNYKRALNALVERYWDPRKTADFYINQILNCNLAKSNLTSFLNTLKNAVSAIKLLTFNDLADYLLFILCYNNIPNYIKKAFDLQCTNIPTTGELFNFVNRYVKSEELQNIHSKGPNNYVTEKVQNRKSFVGKTNSKVMCIYCKDSSHKVYQCKKFSNLDVNARIDFVKSNSLCFNCFANSHVSYDCKSRKCSLCDKSHNSLLHKNVPSKSNEVPSSSYSVPKSFAGLSHSSQESLLGTAFVYLKDSDGNRVPVRALIDSASMECFIEKSLAERLKLPIIKGSGMVEGLAGQKAATQGLIKFQFKSRFKDSEIFESQATIVNKITDYLPNHPVPASIISKFCYLPLADVRFGECRPVQLLMGVAVFSQIISNDRKHVLNGSPIALYTKLGYVILGAFPAIEEASSKSFFIKDSTLEDKLQKFWEQEEVPQVKIESPEQILLEKHFTDNVSRSPEGRYIVRIPFKGGELVSNENAARRNFVNLEKRLSKDTNLKEQYIQFFQDYEKEGHMSNSKIETPLYIMPQNLVVRPDKSSTKLRVVVNCSSKTANGNSLNDLIWSGPKLQQDLGLILLKFRLFKITICADICKMYRQILVHEDDRKYLQLYFRENEYSPLTIKTMNVLPFGLCVSPYLALRVVQQLVSDYGDKYPLAKKSPASAYVHR